MAYAIVHHMLLIRPDYLATLVKKNVNVADFSLAEKMTDLPEEHDLAGQWVDATHTRKFDDLCGGGGVMGRPTTICERNLIGVEDPYFGRMSVLIHEFGHTIQNLAMDTTTVAAVSAIYADAQAQGRFRQADGVSSSYMISNPSEFFAEASGNWFNAADPANPVNSPAQAGRKSLKNYDFKLYQILRGIYADDDWIYPRS